MLTEKQTLGLKDYLRMAGRFLLFSVFGVLPGMVLPVFKNQLIESLLIEAGLCFAVYPAAVKLGFDLKGGYRYLAAFKAALKPAFKYWAVLMVLLYVSDAAIKAMLAPVGLAWSNALLFWMGQSHSPVAADAYIAALIASPVKIPFCLASVCVSAPIIEEFIIRRGLYAGMRKRLPFSAAALLNGALFGALHGKDFIGTGMVGLFLCYVYEKEEKLPTVVLIHSFINLYAVANLFGGKLFGFSL